MGASPQGLVELNQHQHPLKGKVSVWVGGCWGSACSVGVGSNLSDDIEPQ